MHTFVFHDELVTCCLRTTAEADKILRKSSIYYHIIKRILIQLTHFKEAFLLPGVLVWEKKLLADIFGKQITF